MTAEKNLARSGPIATEIRSTRSSSMRPLLVRAVSAREPSGNSCTAPRASGTADVASTMSNALPFADQPLFRSAHEALCFAYGTRSPFLDSVRFLTDMMVRRGRETTLGSLSREERVAQAAMILAYIARMRSEDQACIVARYARDQRRREAQQFLGDAVMLHLTGATNRRMVYELVFRHYGQRVHLGVLAKRFSIRRAVVTDKRAVVERELQRLEVRADWGVNAYLQQAGLLA